MAIERMVVIPSRPVLRLETQRERRVRGYEVDLVLQGGDFRLEQPDLSL